jgi:hypothetical protein
LKTGIILKLGIIVKKIDCKKTKILKRVEGEEAGEEE